MRIVIAEDHEVLRDMMATRLSWEIDGLEVIAQVADGKTAIATVMRERPDVLVADVGLPIVSGIEAVRDLRSFGWDGAVVFVSGYEDDATLSAALEVAALGFVVKTSPFAEVTAAVAAAGTGQEFVGAGVANRWRQLQREPIESPDELLRRAAQGDLEALDRLASPAVREHLRARSGERRRVVESLRPRFASLTPREGQILQHLIAGHSTDLIAELESVAVATVRTQIKAVLQKLAVGSQLAAVALARRAGWPDDDALRVPGLDEIGGEGTWVRDPAPHAAVPHRQPVPRS